MGGPASLADVNVSDAKMCSLSDWPEPLRSHEVQVELLAGAAFSGYHLDAERRSIPRLMGGDVA